MTTKFSESLARLEPVEGNSGAYRCSLCPQEFHVSPVGPRQPVLRFGDHVAEKHPDATLGPPFHWKNAGGKTA